MARALLLLFAAGLIAAAGADSLAGGPIVISLGSVRSTAQQAALAFGFNYVADVASAARGEMTPGKTSYFKWTPEVEVAAAAGAAHSRIIARADANLCLFGLTSVAGVITPNSAGVIHDLFGSAGFETTDALDAVAGVAEVGYVPWLPKCIRWIKAGVFLQGGYQGRLFEPDTTGGRAAPAEGAVLRARGRLAAEKRLPEVGKRAIGLAVHGESWYDLLDQRLHYSARGAVRFFFTQDLSVDVVYERNSGAPAFEEGHQFGVGLTFRLDD